MLVRAKLGGRHEAPAVPVDMQDAVELWARQWGRHGKIVYIDALDPPIPQVRLTLKSDDPRMRAWQDGTLDEEPIETVELTEWDEEKHCYVALGLQELGVGGVIEILNKGNTWSGSGEFGSLQEGVSAASERRKTVTERLRRWARDQARFAASEDSRLYLGRGRSKNDRVPLIQAGVDLGAKGESQA